MKKLIETLNENPLIEEVKELLITPETEKEVLENYSEAMLEKMKSRAANLSVFKIHYLSQGHKVVGYISIPTNSKKTPCIIFNRGGSMEFGALSETKAFMLPSLIASWGYVVIASQYSGNEGGEGKDQFGGSDIEDVLNLKIILNDLPFVDSDKVGMYGGSRGGLMTFLCLAKVDWIKAAVVVAPGGIDKDKEFALRPRLKKRLSTMYDVESEEENRRRSAIHWVEKFSKRTPLLLMHGTSDWRTPPGGTLDLSKRLYEEKVPFRLIMYEGADHGLTQYKRESLLEAKRWFERYLLNEDPLPDLEPHGD